MKVEAQDMRGKRFVLSLKEWESRIFQHEYDHLQGTLYFDRMTPEVLSTIRHRLVVSLGANAGDNCHSSTRVLCVSGISGALQVAP